MTDDSSDRLSDVSLETDNASIRNTINTEIEKVNSLNNVNVANVNTISCCICFSYCSDCYYWFIRRNIDEK
jgi:hypothetical protein